MSDDQKLKQGIEVVESWAMYALMNEQGKQGAVAAAKAALAEADRLRRTQAVDMHREQMKVLADKPVEMARYLAELGLTPEQVQERFGRSLTDEELVAWAQGQDDRLLEVRVVELTRMRRGEAPVPKWATREH
jgi:hypothetical protein